MPRAAGAWLGALLLITSALASASAAAPASERPWSAAARVEPLLAHYRRLPPGSHLPHADAERLLGLAADAYTATRQYDALLAVRREQLALQSTPPAGGSGSAALLARVALADALSKVRAFDEAAAVLRAAQDALVPGAAGEDGARRGLWRARAEVLNCAGGGNGSAAAALAAFTRGLPQRGWPQAPLAGASDVRMALDYVSLLRRAVAEGGGPPAGRAAATVARVGAALLAAGPWTRLDQLPRHYAPALAGRPWYDADAPPWALGPVVAALVAAAPALAAEYRSLAAHAPELLLRESECIHDGAAAWRYMTVNAPWVREVDADGCALATPVACGVLRAARAAGWDGDVLRGTYSAVAGGAHLRSHCGMSNAQVKMHVGLIVPVRRTLPGAGGASVALTAAGEAAPAAEQGAAGTPCAALTVAGETRAWAAGRVLMFDDSFEHEVLNACVAEGGERVVFQLVLPHGDARGAAAVGGGGH